MASFETSGNHLKDQESLSCLPDHYLAHPFLPKYIIVLVLRKILYLVLFVRFLYLKFPVHSPPNALVSFAVLFINLIATATKLQSQQKIPDKRQDPNKPWTVTY